MFHVEVNLIYICYLVNLVFLIQPSGDQLDVPCGPRGEKFANPCKAQTVNDRKGHVLEQFRGALTLYYSPEVCHSLRSKDYDSVQQMVDELGEAWESKSPVERSPDAQTPTRKDTQLQEAAMEPAQGHNIY